MSKASELGSPHASGKSSIAAVLGRQVELADRKKLRVESYDFRNLDPCVLHTCARKSTASVSSTGPPKLVQPTKHSCAELRPQLPHEMIKPTLGAALNLQSQISKIKDPKTTEMPAPPVANTNCEAREFKASTSRGHSNFSLPSKLTSSDVNSSMAPAVRAS